MGGDVAAQGEQIQTIKVSIHTPVWGVTEKPSMTQQHFKVSIHTPVWGVTQLLKDELKPYQVSIHTPVWGVTNPDCWTNAGAGND